MHNVEAETLAKDLREMEYVDLQIGAEQKIPSNSARLVHVEDLLLQAEKEIKTRDLELLKNIGIINDLYSSYRYRIGRFLISPMEHIANRLGLMPKSKTVSNNLMPSNPRDLRK
jgi:hypothetical protein